VQRPTPEQATAAQYLVTAAIYRSDDPHSHPRGSLAGADEALAWALRHV
jgi:hypothetical protein